VFIGTKRGRRNFFRGPGAGGGGKNFRAVQKSIPFWTPMYDRVDFSGGQGVIPKFGWGWRWGCWVKIPKCYVYCILYDNFSKKLRGSEGLPIFRQNIQKIKYFFKSPKNMDTIV
jgi:hypothetical protein